MRLYVTVAYLQCRVTMLVLLWVTHRNLNIVNANMVLQQTQTNRHRRSELHANIVMNLSFLTQSTTRTYCSGIARASSTMLSMALRVGSAEVVVVHVSMAAVVVLMVAEEVEEVVLEILLTSVSVVAMVAVVLMSVMSVVVLVSSEMFVVEVLVMLVVLLLVVSVAAVVSVSP